MTADRVVEGDTAGTLGCWDAGMLRLSPLGACSDPENAPEGGQVYRMWTVGRGRSGEERELELASDMR